MATPTPQARRPRSDRGMVRLSDRDMSCLHWIAQQYAVCLDQLQSLLGRQARQPTHYHETGHPELSVLASKTTADIIARWRDVGFVEVASPLRGKPAWVWITRWGLRELGLDYRYWELNVKALEHLYAVNQVRLWVESGEDKTLRGGIWKSERALRAERPAASPGYARGHLPDAEVTVPNGEVVAIEVEISNKNPQWLREIMADLAATYDRIRYIAREQVYPKLMAARSEMDEENRGRFRIDLFFK